MSRREVHVVVQERISGKSLSFRVIVFLSLLSGQLGSPNMKSLRYLLKSFDKCEGSNE